MSSPVVHTNLARCRDCYRCVRSCPVKAIQVQNGQAQVVPELCIYCGDCVLECPQGAKVVRDDRMLIEQALAEGRQVVASVAPSAPSYFDMVTFGQMERALKGLGFAAAGETAFGAEMVGIAHGEYVAQGPTALPVIASSCPMVVELIEKYYPDLIANLAPIVSPMIAHGRWLRQTYGEDAFVVFIGPCIAKKGEMLQAGIDHVIDAALTFQELQEWLEKADIPWPAAAAAVSEIVPRANARVFPVEGGLVGTAELDTDILSAKVVTTSGFDACQDVLDAIRDNTLQAELVELMGCEGGCINGPAMKQNQISVYLARQRVLQYAARRQPQPLPQRGEWPDLERLFQDKRVEQAAFSEEEIQRVLHMVDKYTPEDELNCGACGYPTCRDKAVATLRGLAEATMCIPYMRRRAEDLRHVLMAVTPEPCIIIDNRLRIQDLSPSAEAMFGCTLESAAGKRIQEILPDSAGFAIVRNTGQPVTGQQCKYEDRLLEQNIVPVEGQSLIVGILRDVTEQLGHQEQLDRIRTETLERTQEVVKKQMIVAQEIAQLLGETTAESKMMLSRLAGLLQEDTKR